MFSLSATFLRGLLPCFALCCAVACNAQGAPVERQPPSASPSAPVDVPQSPQQDDVPAYTRDIFEKPVDPSQLAFLKQYAGHTTGDMLHDKAARKILWSFIPKCEFHYGKDMPLDDAFEVVTEHSRDAVDLVDNRYLAFTGANGPYLRGRGGMWIDLEKGIALGVFYFTPTNGEPTPAVVVFASQVKEPSLKMSQMPPSFVEFLSRWTAAQGIPPVTPRYFISGNKKRLLLEHDEDYCAAYGDSPSAHPACDQVTADAADVDVNAAYYLDQIHYATNGTAWMLGPDQIAWLGVRDHSCGNVADPLACRIRLTRERTHVIMHLPPPHAPRGRR